MCLSISKQTALKLIHPDYGYVEYKLSYAIYYAQAMIFHKHKSQRKWRPVQLGVYWRPYQDAVLPIIGPENVVKKRITTYRL